MTRGPKLLAATLAILVLTTSAAFAQNEKGKKKAEPGANAQVFRLPEDVTLTAEQQEKLNALKKEWGPKIAELQGKVNALLTPDQRKARDEATKKAAADKVQGKARQTLIDDATQLTAEQKPAWDKLQKELNDLNASVRAKLGEILTEEQKAKIPAFAAKKKKNS
jgi:hypothetical protein